jgi:hypothetical protein
LFRAATIATSMAITGRGRIAPHRLRPKRSGGRQVGNFFVLREECRC